MVDKCNFRRRRLVKNYFWRKKFTPGEMYRNRLNGVFENPYQTVGARAWGQMQLHEDEQGSRRSRCKVICLGSSRRRGVISYFKLNRGEVHMMAQGGFIPGLQVISW